MIPFRIEAKLLG